MSEHTFQRYEAELMTLKEKVMSMGGLVEKAIKRSMNSLVKQDVKRAEKVIQRDSAINDLEMEIDGMTRNLLALRQPAANDLRFVITTIKIVSDLERMGDLAENIAKKKLATEEYPLPYIASLQLLSDQVLEQLSLAIQAFGKGDTELAMTCIACDRKVNEQYQAQQHEYLTHMIEDPRQITAALFAGNIAKNLERISDHAMNVAEMVVYMTKGLDIRHRSYDEVVALLAQESDTSAE